MTHLLHVSTQGQAVGRLTFDQQESQYEFKYVEDWMSASGAYYLAPAIPLDRPPVRGAVQRFLDNLLPEGRALEVVAAQFAVSKSNTFALIYHLGKEPVGAFTFDALDATAEDARQYAENQLAVPIRRPISHEELTLRIRTRDLTPFAVWDGKVRRSLAGYQDKLKVIVEHDDISLADGALCSTHLLKPESRNPGMPYMVANEHFA